MTTLALVGGMLPLAIGSGPGAEERRTIAVRRHRRPDPLAVPDPGRVPVAYSLADDAAEWLAARRAGVAEARILDSGGTA
jgi:hydrophobic/amphiphilic exporter-1 (mainly G- bacteria), HAE1 family